jgi:hypothetical protein
MSHLNPAGRGRLLKGEPDGLSDARKQNAARGRRPCLLSRVACARTKPCQSPSRAAALGFRELCSLPNRERHRNQSSVNPHAMFPHFGGKTGSSRRRVVASGSPRLAGPACLALPAPLFCVIDGATCGRRRAAAAARAEPRRLAVDARGPTPVRRPSAPPRLCCRRRPLPQTATRSATAGLRAVTESRDNDLRWSRAAERPAGEPAAHAGFS